MKPRLSLVLALLALSVVVRLVPYALPYFGVVVDHGNTAYPWNFSPILPMCVFGGAFFAQRRLACAIPLAIYLLGDLGIWALTGRLDWAFYAYQPIVYLSVVLVATTGFLLRRRRSWRRVAATGLASSLGFYVLTNFGLWAFSDGSIYPHTLAGLGDCYLRAIPYLRNTLISMAVFLPVLFSRVALTGPATLRVRPLVSTGT